MILPSFFMILNTIKNSFLHYFIIGFKLNLRTNQLLKGGDKTLVFCLKERQADNPNRKIFKNS